MKKCSNLKCIHKEKLQPLSNFHKFTKSKDGLQPRCKHCRSLYFSKNKNLSSQDLRNQRLKIIKKKAICLVDVFFTSIKLGQNPCKSGKEIIKIINDLYKNYEK